MTVISDPFFYLLAVPIVLLLGMGKGGLGPAVVTLGVPVLSFVVPPVQGAAILLPILCVTDLFAVRTFRRNFAVEHLKILIPAGIVGICIAAVLMGQLDQDIIRVLIGLMVVLFCLDHWLRPDISNTRMAGRWGGYFWGMVSGFTSTQIHAGAAPVSIYLLPQRMDKVKLMGTLAIFFTAINYVKLVPYTLLGALNVENFMTSLILMPLAPVGVKLGRVLLDKINQRILYRYLYIALFLSGVKLCYDGVMV